MFQENLNDRLDKAEALCKRQGGRMTKSRRQVLGLIYQTNKPAGAYELLRQLRQLQVNAEPPTVYRALEFLQTHHLIHRIESMNAYIACSDPEAQHPRQFLMCNNCSAVIEMCDNTISHTLHDCAERKGFRVDSFSAEITGLCQSCHA